MGDSFTPRVVVRKNWTGLADTETVSKAAEMLCDFDWLRMEVMRGDGRPSTHYLVNPLAVASKV